MTSDDRDECNEGHRRLPQMTLVLRMIDNLAMEHLRRLGADHMDGLSNYLFLNDSLGARAGLGVSSLATTAERPSSSAHADLSLYLCLSVVWDRTDL